MIKWWRTRREMHEAAAKSDYMMRAHIALKMSYWRKALKKHGAE